MKGCTWEEMVRRVLWFGHVGRCRRSRRRRKGPGRRRSEVSAEESTGKRSGTNPFES